MLLTNRINSYLPCLETAKGTDGRKELRFHLKQKQRLVIGYDYRPGKSTLLFPCSTVPRCKILACLKAHLNPADILAPDVSDFQEKV